jgi:hypothetical protein
VIARSGINRPFVLFGLLKNISFQLSHKKAGYIVTGFFLPRFGSTQTMTGRNAITYG